MALPKTATRLHRSTTERIVVGVCGGLAESFDVDPSLVRFAFIIATLWGGVGVLTYIALALVLPVDGEISSALSPQRAERSRNFAGLLLLALGGLLLITNLGWAPWLTWSLFWPGVLVIVGVGLLVFGSSSREEPTGVHS
jgi:phage shock protein PspC (stress-responsive transcriptional regulator)